MDGPETVTALSAVARNSGSKLIIPEHIQSSNASLLLMLFIIFHKTVLQE